MAAGRARQPSDGGAGTLSLCFCSMKSAELSKRGGFGLFSTKGSAAGKG